LKTINAPGLIALDIPELPSILGDQLIVENGRLVVYGDAEVYKSFVVQSMLWNISEGVDWFGHKLKAQMPTLYVQVEVPLGNFKWRVHSLATATGLVGSDAWFTLDGEFRFDGQGGIEDIIASIKEHAIGAVIFDPLNLMMVGSENSDEAVRALVLALNHIRTETNAMVGIVHHANKGLWHEGKRVNTGMGKVSGSKGLASWPDTILHVHRVDGFDHVIELVWEKVRNGPRPEKQWLRFDVSTGVLVAADNDPRQVAQALIASGPIPILAFTAALKEKCEMGINASNDLRKQLKQQGLLREVRDPSNPKRKLVARPE
jgi:hypothetical protein